LPFFVKRIVIKRISLLSLCLSLGLLGTTPAAKGQALLPYVPQLDTENLQKQGLALAEEAAQLARFQQYESALQRAQLATQLAPASADAWGLLGRLYLETDRIERSIEVLKKARRLDSENARILFALGSAYFRQNTYDKAVETLEAGLKVEPEVPGALFDLGNAYYMMGEYSQAIAKYEEAFAINDQFWPAINNIGLVKYEQADVEAALSKWRQSMSIEREAAEPQLAIAVALFAQGKKEQGLAMGESALRLDGRYANIEFLEENLWGDRLLADTKEFLNHPRMQEVIAKIDTSLDSEFP
jgi:tetratricopeptide (TPR) repeat protein